MKIAIIHDEASELGLEAEYLSDEARDATIDAFDNPDDFLFSGGGYDICFFDYDLPGYEIEEYIQASFRKARTTVIMTGPAGVLQTRRDGELPSIVVIPKEMTKEDLVDVLWMLGK